jgi:hypothetical protein
LFFHTGVPVYSGFEQPPMPTTGWINFGVARFRHDHKKIARWMFLAAR